MAETSEKDHPAPSQAKPSQATAKPTATKSKSTKTSSQPTPKKSKLTRYNILFTIFVIAWTVLATCASQYLAAYPLHWILGEKLLEPGWTLVYYLLTYAITLAVLISLPPAIIKTYQKKHRRQINVGMMYKIEKDLKSTPTSMGVQHLPTFVDIGLAPIAYVVYLFIAMVLTSIMSGLFSWFMIDQAQDVGFGYYVTGLDRFFAIIAIAFVAPIAEELIMRGWFYGKVRRKWSAPVATIIVSLVFAILHGQWNVGVNVFALSIVLCTLREITGTIWSGMLLHILSNSIAFYMLYIAI